MRYVYLVVAIGLLVVGIGSYSAQAAQGQAAPSSRLISGPGTMSLKRIAGTALGGRFMQARLTYEALKEEERLRLVEAQKDSAARERFGDWGPDLVRAAEMFGQDPEELYRVMNCESRGDANADNGVCKGLFQFNPGTWAGTPFAGFSIYDGQAQIYAAAWMFSQGRKGEWTCK